MRNQLSSKGFTLVEVLVATGLVALLSVVMTTLMVRMQKDVSLYSAKSGIESVRNSVRMNAINGAAILKSSAYNTTLSSCLNGTTATACIAEKKDFKLVDALDVPLAGQGVFYDLQGKPCNTWSVTCPLRIQSQMQLVCPAAATSCAKASAMNVFVQIDYHEDLSKAKGVELRPITDTVTVALSSYYNSSLTSGTTDSTTVDLVCEKGFYMTGIDTNGKVICIASGGGGGSSSTGGDGNGRDGDGGGGGQGSDGGGDGGGASGSCSM